MYFDFEIFLRLVVAAVSGGVIGFERAGTRHEAGLRTHILVCLGSATVMVLSDLMVAKYGIQSEVLRMGAQVISGIGFLGAGSIISEGNKVRGVTTAAGVWTTACVGLVIGAGYYLIALSIVCLILFAIIALKPLRKKLGNKAVKKGISFVCDNEKTMPLIVETLMEKGIEITKIKYSDAENKLVAELEVMLPQGIAQGEVAYILSSIKGIKEFNI